MRLLIVEDELDLAQSLKIALQREGFAVDIVTDGETALRRIELYHEDYDLIILDLTLPKKSGLEICERVRAEKITTPILVLTARMDLGGKVRALDLGADDYLVKPFSLEELTARIRALLRRPTEIIPTRLSVPGITLDNATRKVICHSKEVDLTVKEYALLEYLMRHTNQVLHRNQILDHLWGFDFDSFSNVVDVHIKNLRKKIKTHKLETVRGIGYCLRSD